jgi:hypothetical protein
MVLDVVMEAVRFARGQLAVISAVLALFGCGEESYSAEEYLGEWSYEQGVSTGMCRVAGLSNSDLLGYSEPLDQRTRVTISSPKSGKLELQSNECRLWLTVNENSADLDGAQYCTINVAKTRGAGEYQSLKLTLGESDADFEPRLTVSGSGYADLDANGTPLECPEVRVEGILMKSTLAAER